MPEIIEFGIQDILALLPRAKPAGGEKSFGQAIDILICAAGFEPRATAIIDSIASSKIGLMIVIKYPTNVTDNSEALNAFASMPNVKELYVAEYDGTSSFQVKIRELVEQCCVKRMCVVLDISAMSSYVFFRLIPAILRQPNLTLSVFYSEADNYAPTSKDWQTFLDKTHGVTKKEELSALYAQYERQFQTEGVETVYESEFFPGAETRGLPVKIVALPSFSLDRVKSMLAFCERELNARQDSVIWLIGDPPNATKNGWRSEAIEQLYLVAADRGRRISTLRYEHALRTLDDIWIQEAENNKLVVVSAGSKMQNLAVALFLTMHPDASLVLSEPKKFKADSFSEGIGPTWILEFGPVNQLVELLEKRGDLSFDWGGDTAQ